MSNYDVYCSRKGFKCIRMDQNRSNRNPYGFCATCNGGLRLDTLKDHVKSHPDCSGEALRYSQNATNPILKKRGASDANLTQFTENPNKIQKKSEDSPNFEQTLYIDTKSPGYSEDTTTSNQGKHETENDNQHPLTQSSKIISEIVTVKNLHIISEELNDTALSRKHTNDQDLGPNQKNKKRGRPPRKDEVKKQKEQNIKVLELQIEKYKKKTEDMRESITDLKTQQNQLKQQHEEVIDNIEKINYRQRIKALKNLRDELGNETQHYKTQHHQLTDQSKKDTEEIKNLKKKLFNEKIAREIQIRNQEVVKLTGQLEDKEDCEGRKAVRQASAMLKSMNAKLVESQKEIKIARKNPKWVEDQVCDIYTDILKLRDLMDNWLVQKRIKDCITVQEIELKQLRKKVEWFSQKKKITPDLKTWFKQEKGQFARQLKQSHKIQIDDRDKLLNDYKNQLKLHDQNLRNIQLQIANRNKDCEDDTEIVYTLSNLLVCFGKKQIDSQIEIFSRDNFKFPVTKSEHEQIERKAKEITKQSETENIQNEILKDLDTESTTHFEMKAKLKVQKMKKLADETEQKDNEERIQKKKDDAVIAAKMYESRVKREKERYINKRLAQIKKEQKDQEDIQMETQSIHVLTESNPEHSTPTQLKKKITKTVSFGNDVIFYKYRIPQKHLEGRKRQKQQQLIKRRQREIEIEQQSPQAGVMESSMEETSKDLLQEDKFCKISWIEYQKKHKLSAKTIRDYQKKRQLKAKRKQIIASPIPFPPENLIENDMILVNSQIPAQEQQNNHELTEHNPGYLTMKLENRLPGYCPDPSKVKLDPNSVLAKSLTRAKEFGQKLLLKQKTEGQSFNSQIKMCSLKFGQGYDLEGKGNERRQQLPMLKLVQTIINK